MSRKAGVAQLLEENGAGVMPACDSQQLAMFEEPQEATGTACDTGGKRGRGRPKGAMNRSTVEMRGFIENKYAKMPLDFLVGLFNKSNEEVIKDTGCKPADVIKVQTSAAVASLPYLHQKMPLEVAVSETKRHLVLLEGMTSEAREVLDQEDAIIIEVDEHGDEINSE